MQINSSPESPDNSIESGLAFPASLAFSNLERKSPEYQGKWWQVCRALYEGGRRLFTDKDLFSQVFPQHMSEPATVYAERCKRAFYINYPGEIVDYIVSGLFGRPVELMAETDHDEYYGDLFEDTSPPGGRKLHLNQLLREQVVTALLCKRAWTQVDFPGMDSFAENRAEQEQTGEADAYMLPVEPECVYDWEEDKSGELLWANVCTTSNPRSFIDSERSMVTKTWMIYTRIAWARYETTYPKNKPPSHKDQVGLVDQGVHTFGRVPLVRLELPDGLWCMNKLAGIAIEHLNKRCALSWAEYRTLYQERYEFSGDSDPRLDAPAIADDQGRATNQIHGIGYIQHRHSSDRVEFVGPGHESFQVALESIRDLRNEMHRVMFQMALTFDNSSSVVGRSGNSKAEDRKAHGVVLVGLGEMVRDHIQEVVQMITDARGDDLKWTASGMDKFDSESLADMLAGAEILANIQIPSKTFNKRHDYMVARTRLGDEASAEDLKKIEAELDEHYEHETEMAGHEDPFMNGDVRLIDMEEEPEMRPPMPMDNRRGAVSDPRFVP